MLIGIISIKKENLYRVFVEDYFIDINKFGSFCLVVLFWFDYIFGIFLNIYRVF